MRLSIKRLFQAIALIVAFPGAALTLFGRIKPVYTFFAQSFALGPGMPGSYLRAAYYKMTLSESSLDVTLSLGTYFVQPDSVLKEGCFNRRVLRDRSCFHRRSLADRIARADPERPPAACTQCRRHLERLAYDRITVGSDCWIGDGAVVMADLGEGVTVGAGSVVTKPVLSGTVVVGNPARPLQRASSPEGVGLETVARHS